MFKSLRSIISLARLSYLLYAYFLSLKDFNWSRLLTRNITTNETCPYGEYINAGKTRSPEEYAAKPQTAMVDIYSLGNIFYILLSNNYPWRAIPTWKEAAELVKEGKRPPMLKEVLQSEHPVDRALLEAMHMSQEQDPKERASALQVLNVLQDVLEEIDPGRLQAWGVKF